MFLILSHNRTWCLGDSTTNKALESKLQRESGWSKIILNNIFCPPNTSIFERAKALELEQNKSHYQVVEPLITQGDTVKLLLETNTNPQVLKFAINAAMDSLPTFINLCKWGKRHRIATALSAPKRVPFSTFLIIAIKC